MIKFLLPAIVILVFFAGGFFLYQNFQTKQTPQPTSTPQVAQTPPAQPTPTSSPKATTDSCEVLTKGSSDVPTLYQEGITWEQSTITEYEVPLGETGSKKIKGCLVKSKNTTDLKARDVRLFYSAKLITFEWKPLVSADGMFSSIESYQKATKFFVVQQKTVPGSLSDQTPPPPSLIVELFYTQ